MRSNECRHWLLTWTTYGSWMPGDERGSTSVTHSIEGAREFHNRVGTFPAAPNDAIQHYADSVRKHPVVILDRTMARLIDELFRETAAFRGWNIRILAIMATHIHVVVQVNGDPRPAQLLKDLKSYASRRLNRHFPDRIGRWWTDSGSARFLHEEANILRAIAYVRDQPNALIVREQVN